MIRIVFALLALAAPAAALAWQSVPPAIYTDPVPDPQNPPRMEVLHIPSGKVKINGVAYIPSGPGPHPVVVLCHGLPGNEKNLDLAQALRRAGWTVVTFNYRGSWGSPGEYSFANDLADVDAVLAYLRTPESVVALGSDPKRMVLMGHSLGGWATLLTAAHDRGLIGAVAFSPGNIGALAGLPRDMRIKALGNNGMEALATTSEKEADEIGANAQAYNFINTASGLTGTPLLLLTSDDGLRGPADALAASIRKQGGSKVSEVHVATDHSWSGARIRLASEIIRWLDGLPK
ncbi:MAG: alpha/beta fold hydrolase [Pseudomonadota bacterium]